MDITWRTQWRHNVHHIMSGKQWRQTGAVTAQHRAEHSEGVLRSDNHHMQILVCIVSRRSTHTMAPPHAYRSMFSSHRRSCEKCSALSCVIIGRPTCPCHAMPKTRRIRRGKKIVRVSINKNFRSVELVVRQIITSSATSDIKDPRQ